MNLPQVDKILTTLLPYIIGAFFGVVGSFITGFSKEFFDERLRKAKHKRDVARQVLKICNEASTGNFRSAPRDVEYVNSVLTDLEGVDKNKSVEMEEFISSWQIFARERLRTPLNSGDVKFAKEELGRADGKRKILVVWANKIRTGK